MKGEGKNVYVIRVMEKGCLRIILLYGCQYFPPRQQDQDRYERRGGRLCIYIMDILSVGNPT